MRPKIILVTLLITELTTTFLTFDVGVVIGVVVVRQLHILPVKGSVIGSVLPSAWVEHVVVGLSVTDVSVVAIWESIWVIKVSDLDDGQ